MLKEVNKIKCLLSFPDLPLLRLMVSHPVVNILIRCSTSCTCIPTRGRTGEPERRRQSRVGANNRECRKNSTPKPDLEQRHQECTKQSPTIEAVHTPQEWRRCRDTRSMQDEDRGQIHLRIDRNSHLEVQDGPGSQRSGPTN